MLELERKLKLLKYSFATIFCHLLMGICQERILRQPYKIENVCNITHLNVIANLSQIEYSDQSEQQQQQQQCNQSVIEERFTFAFSYVAVQCFIYALVAKGAIMSYPHEKNETPQKYYYLPALFYVLAMVTSNLALQWIPYTTQVIAKSSKPIAIMILGLVIARKKYKLQKYLFVIVVVLSLILFSYKDNYDQNDLMEFRGTVLIGFSLVMDGMMGAIQDRMRTKSKPSSLNLMFFLNTWSSLYLAICLLITSEGMEFVNFCLRHPKVIFHLGILIIVGTLGQFFISLMISNFGALPLSIVMTVRKFLTVFLSVLIYNNKLSNRQWLAAAIIFLALILDSLYQLKSSSSSSSSTSSSSSSSTSSERTTIETHSENSDNNLRNLNLSSVIIEQNFNNSIITAKQTEIIDKNSYCEHCEVCSTKF